MGRDERREEPLARGSRVCQVHARLRREAGGASPVAEWRIEIDREWSLRPGVYGRGLERLLPADIWSELAGTYVGADIEDNWNALFRTTALFRRVAKEVGEALGYAYPQHVDDGITAHLEGVRRLPPRA